MALAMTRPWKHPKSGVYWLRRRVPKDLIQVIGRREVQKSLGTRDPAEAKQKLVQALAELDARWANLTEGQRSITEREAHAYALSAYKSWLDENRDEPSFNEFWVTRLYPRLWTDTYIDKQVHFPSGLSEEESDHLLNLVQDNVSLKQMHRHCENKADEILSKYGLTQNVYNNWTLARAVAAALQRASLILEKEAQGIFEVGTEPTIFDSDAVPYPGQRPVPARATAPVAKHATVSKSVSMRGLIEAWWREAKATGRKPSTYESYSNTFANFARFLKHDDSGAITEDDVIRFKDHRLMTPSLKTGKVPSAKTVKDSDLTALKAVFGWAVANRRLPNNPAASVTMKVGKAPRLRSKGFTDTEATAILQAALAHLSEREYPETAAGKKWVPWLCALTGARVGEMGQVRKQDVFRWQGHWVVRITPEAGTVKTNEAREIVLHAQLIDLGFPAFVQAAADGPLFLRPGKDGEVLGPLQTLKNRLAEFARAIVPDPNVAPMHGFRHRFKTVGMEVGVAPRILDAIQGQAARSVADTYGDVTLVTVAAAIAKFPSYIV